MNYSTDDLDVEEPYTPGDEIVGYSYDDLLKKISKGKDINIDLNIWKSLIHLEELKYIEEIKIGDGNIKIVKYKITAKACNYLTYLKLVKNARYYN